MLHIYLLETLIVSHEKLRDLEIQLKEDEVVFLNEFIKKKQKGFLENLNFTIPLSMQAGLVLLRSRSMSRTLKVRGEEWETKSY
jgi:hypothetical protein